MGAAMMLKNFFYSLDAALKRGSKRAKAFQQLPDRRLLNEAYLPAFAALGGRILWVGVRRYTADYYTRLEAQGAEVWTTEIDPTLERWGRSGRHRTGDICEADSLFSDMVFDGLMCNGILGYGVDSEAQQIKAITAMAKIVKPGGRLLVGWNTDKIPDPVAAGYFAPYFTPMPFADQPARVGFDDVTHIYDSFVRNP